MLSQLLGTVFQFFQRQQLLLLLLCIDRACTRICPRAFEVPSPVEYVRLRDNTFLRHAQVGLHLQDATQRLKPSFLPVLCLMEGCFQCLVGHLIRPLYLDSVIALLEPKGSKIFRWRIQLTPVAFLFPPHVRVL